MNQTPSSIRQLFAFICIFNGPHNPLELYNRFFDDMTEDIQDDKEGRLLCDLEGYFKTQGLSLETFGLPDRVTSNNRDEIVGEVDQD